MSKKKIAVIGCGAWGKNLVRVYHELNRLDAICDVNEATLQRFKEKYPGVRAYSDYHSLLNQEQLTAVVISSPASTHYQLVKEALHANKDVMVEKPIALDYDEGRELVDLAHKKEKILMIGHLLIYHPAITRLKKMIDEGELGKIQYIYSNRLNLGKFRKEENILWSFAPHDISVILHLLNEMPTHVFASGGQYLNKDVEDITVSTLDFPSGIKAHIFVSWLHPYKEQKLVIIGDKRMIMFDDVKEGPKLYSYDYKIEWRNRHPVPLPEQAKPVEIDNNEPLKAECEHFVDCIESRKKPLTNGEEGLRILKVLRDCQKSLTANGNHEKTSEKEKKYFLHGTSAVDEPCEIGDGTKIWHYSHILKDCNIGQNCVIGQNVSIGPNVKIGNNVKIQNNVSVYEGVTLDDDVFCGPSMVFTNVTNPRSHWPRKDEFKQTLVKKGASLGANSTIVCGINIGEYALVGAGAVVTKDVPDYSMVYGAPAELKGWVCYCGNKLDDLPVDTNSTAESECSSCRRKYEKHELVVKEIITATN